MDALKKDELLFQPQNNWKSYFHWTQICIQNQLVVEVDFDVDALMLMLIFLMILILTENVYVDVEVVDIV